MNYSRQRELIKNIVKDRKDHPSAQKIYELVHKEDESMSLATVYRNLHLMTQNNELNAINVDNIEHFDPCTKNHLHFVCDNCHKIYDINIPEESLNTINDYINSNIGNIYNHKLVIHGICKDCMNDGEFKK